MCQNRSMAKTLLAPLRGILRKAGVTVWGEFTFGNSYRAYRGLDAFVRVFGTNTESDDEEAVFLLNTQSMPRDRKLLRPEDWWLCHTWVSVGQKPVFSQWKVKYGTALTSSVSKCRAKL